MCYLYIYKNITTYVSSNKIMLWRVQTAAAAVALRTVTSAAVYFGPSYTRICELTPRTERYKQSVTDVVSWLEKAIATT